MEYLRTDVPTKFPQIYVAAGPDTTYFLDVVGKMKVAQWKRKADVSKHNWYFMQNFRLFKSLFKLFAILGKKKRILLKQGDCCRAIVGLSTMRIKKFGHCSSLVRF